MVNPKLKKAFLLLLILLSGFGREYVMVNINWVIKHLTLGAPNYAQAFFNPLLSWDVRELDLLKWILTIVFTVYFLILTYILIKTLFPEEKTYHKITLLSYSLLVLAAGVVFVIGFITKTGKELYSTVRTLMGVAQSFLPLMVLYLLFKFMPNKNDHLN